MMVEHQRGTMAQQPRPRRRPRRPPSPPVLLPPRWGEDVAPPPTPFLTSPETSPTHLMPPPQPPLRPVEEGRVPSRHRCGHPHHHRRASKQQQQQKRASRSGNNIHVYQNHRYPEFRLHPHHPPPPWPGMVPAPPSAFPNQFEFFLRGRNDDSASSLAGAVGSADDQVVTYAYRFTGDSGVDREEIPFGRHYPGGRLTGHRRINRCHHHSRQSLHAPPPPNSQSSSPATTGSSPEAVAAVSALSAPLTTSPASPMEGDLEEEPRPLSILRSSSAVSAMKKSVQWVSDGKRRPQDISRHDRRLVKNQVDHAQ